MISDITVNLIKITCMRSWHEINPPPFFFKLSVNLFVSIFINSYVSSNLHVSTLTLIIHNYGHEQVKLKKKR